MILHNYFSYFETIDSEIEFCKKTGIGTLGNLIKSAPDLIGSAINLWTTHTSVGQYPQPHRSMQVTHLSSSFNTFNTTIIQII
ncbi:hypothetical protein ACHWQZ_G011317 [Mnemiopsis leidyi]